MPASSFAAPGGRWPSCMTHSTWPLFLACVTVLPAPVPAACGQDLKVQALPIRKPCARSIRRALRVVHRRATSISCAARRARNALQCARLKAHPAQNWHQTGTSVVQKTKKSAGANLLTLVYLGSPTWARTRDLRINSRGLTDFAGLPETSRDTRIPLLINGLRRMLVPPRPAR